jgi:hypothetical protein
MDISKLKDAELWEGIAANCQAMVEVARMQAAITGGRAAGAGPKTRAELVAAHQSTWEKLKREYIAYDDELGRRGLLDPQSLILMV